MASINPETITTTVKKLGLPTTIALLALGANFWFVNQMFKSTEKANAASAEAIAEMAKAVAKLDDDLRTQANRMDFMIEKMRDVQDAANTAILLSRAMRSIPAPVATVGPGNTMNRMMTPPPPAPAPEGGR